MQMNSRWTASVRYDCRCFCFFFQAEDGIRDPLVTGVQTCALPIYSRRRRRPVGPPAPSARMKRRGFAGKPWAKAAEAIRSEERRVGKECRSRRWKDQKREKHEVGQMKPKQYADTGSRKPHIVHRQR